MATARHRRPILAYMLHVMPLLVMLQGVVGSGGEVGGGGGGLGGEPGKERFILHWGNASDSERGATLRDLQLAGYSCRLPPPSAASTAVCIKNRNPPEYLPKTPEELRDILGRVRLGSWLPDLLCTKQEHLSGIKAEAEGSTSSCRELVKSALSECRQEVSVPIYGAGFSLTASSTLEETPWVKVIETFTSEAFVGEALPIAVNFALSVLATTRATEQLMPTLKKVREAKAVASATDGITSSANRGHIGDPSTAAIEKLLTMLPAEPSTIVSPSLRVDFPKRGGRVNGFWVPLVTEVTLGTELENRLEAGSSTIKSEGISAQVKTDNGEGQDGGHQTSWRPPLFAILSPSLDRCEIRVLVDELEAARFPVAPSGTTRVSQGLSLVYAPRCGEHPEHDAAVAAGNEWWTSDKDAWYVEARTVDQVCTTDVFGRHRMRTELVCCGKVADDGANKPTVANGAGHPAQNGVWTAAETVAAAPELSSPLCETLAGTAPIEYFHTSNGVAEVSGVGERMEAPLSVVEPLPDRISVSLYLDGTPDTSASLTVPRWSSEGEVWQAAFEVCSTVFGPEQGVLVDTPDCLDLATAAIRHKKVDLYHQTVNRLEAHLKKRLPGLEPGDIMGHTGAIPEKVAALGALVRNGGEHVGTVCEVGFNAGHSSLNWLLNSRPSVRVLAFDLGENSYIYPAVDFLQALFPSRLEVILGDSKETIPTYTRREELAGRNPKACNIIFVDGDHSEEGAYSDVVAFELLANRTWHKLAIDDVDIPAVAKAWNRFSEGERGRLERVVQGGAQHSLNVKHSGSAEDTWGIVEDNQAHRLFMSSGHNHLGIGYYRLPAASK